MSSSVNFEILDSGTASPRQGHTGADLGSGSLPHAISAVHECQRVRVMVIVPAYNEGSIIEATVRELLRAGRGVIVVDDGYPG